MEILELTWLDNSLRTWITALAVTLGAWFALWLIQRVVIGRLKAIADKTTTKIDDLITDLLERTRGLFLLLVSLYAGTLVLALPERVVEIVGIISLFALLIQAALWGNGVINYVITRIVQERMQEDPSTATSISALGIVAKVTLWTIIVLLAIDNIQGVEITSLIASLGIGGVAVALAVQNILGDLFASLSIALDKPFAIGDFIIVDELMGTVEHIGLKSTRVRSLYGEQLVFSNADLLNSRIRNYKRMMERRVVFNLGVIYQTPAEKLARVPGIVHEIIETQDQARFDRAHFNEFGDSSLNYEIVYYVLNPDYNVYMDTQQAINLEIYKRFRDEGIEFAYPTQTLLIEKT
jgi:small-conductance mechanosensitive channel